MVDPQIAAGDSPASFSLSHPAFIDFGLALGWSTTNLPAFAWDPAYLDQCLGDWIGLQVDPDAATQRLVSSSTVGPRYDVLVDVLIANRGVLAESTQRQVWQFLGRGFISNRAARDGLVSALTRLPAWFIREGIRYGLLLHLSGQSSSLTADVLDALQNGILDAKLFQQLRQRDVRRRTSFARAADAVEVDRISVERRVNWLSSAATSEERRKSANWLAAKGGALASSALQAALKHDIDQSVRGAAATALGANRDREAVPALIDALHDSAGSVRGSAATALGAIGTWTSVPALVGVLRGSDSQRQDSAAIVRGAAATALGAIGSRDGVPALIDGLADSEANVRGSAATALGAIRSSEAVPALINTLEDTAEHVRGAAATALGAIRSNDSIPALVEALNDRAANVRGSAATALGAIRSDEAVPALIDALRDNADNVRGAAAMALSAIGNPDGVAPLIDALADTAENVRGAAASALSLIGSPDGAPALLSCLGDPAANVRGSAATALGRMGSYDAVDGLCELLHDTDSSVRGSAATALGAIGSFDAVTTLRTALLQDTGASVRGAAATALGRIGTTEALPELSAALKLDGSANVRGSAATAIGALGSSVAVPSLTAALADDDAKVRGSAATALGRIGSADAVADLCGTLSKDVDSYTRGSAATGLGRIGNPSAVPSLVSALRDDQNFKVRASAVGALGRLTVTSTLPEIQRCITNRDENLWVRAAAVNALSTFGSEIEQWLIEIADDIAIPNGREGAAARAFRGAIVNLVSHRAVKPETIMWLDNVARSDADPINRTNAIEGLSAANSLSVATIRFTIAPETTRPDRRRRDSDNGVCGSAAAAVIRLCQRDENSAMALLAAVVDLIVDRSTWSSVVNAALSAVEKLPLATATRVLAEIKRLAGARAEDNEYFFNALGRQTALIDARHRSAADYQLLLKSPESVLSNFRTAHTTRSVMTTLDAQPVIALITAIPVETRALYTVLDERGLIATSVQRSGRYFDFIELQEKQPTRIVVTQATDKGGQAASAVTHAVVSGFSPQLIILLGVCGGFPERGVAVNDVIVAKNIFSYDPQRVQPDGHGERPQVYRADEQLLRLSSYLHNKGALNSSLGAANLHLKDYASGEKVIAWGQADLRKYVLSLSTDVYGVETEAHGVMHSVWETFKAESFVGAGMIKCVSDLGDEGMSSNKNARQFEAACIAARVALDIAGGFQRADTS